MWLSAAATAAVAAVAVAAFGGLAELVGEAGARTVASVYALTVGQDFMSVCGMRLLHLVALYTHARKLTASISPE